MIRNRRVWMLLLLLIFAPVCFFSTSLILTILTPLIPGHVVLKTYEIRAPEDGFVESFSFVKGDILHANSKILQMDSPALTASLDVLYKDINELNNNYTNLKSNLAVMKLAAKYSLKAQHNQYNRYAFYRQSGAVSLIMMDTAQNNLDTAQNRYNSILADEANANIEFDLKANELNLQKQNLIARQKSLAIYTTESGFVNDIYFESHLFITKGTTLLTLVSNKDPVVIMNVRASKVDGLVGRTVHILLPDYTMIHGLVTYQPSVSDLDKNVIRLNSTEKDNVVLIIKCKLPSKYIIDGLKLQILPW